MTVKEQAKDLVDKMSFQYRFEDNFINAIDLTFAKRSAIICVDEIIKEIKNMVFDYDMDYHYNNISPSHTTIPYWEQVKEEIQKIEK